MSGFDTAIRRVSCGRSDHRAAAGFSLIEIVIVMAIMGAVMMVTMPSVSRWFENQELKGAVRSAADLLLLARSEAIRSGNPHVILFGVDPDSTMMTNPDGGFAPLREGLVGRSRPAMRRKPVARRRSQARGRRSSSLVRS